MIYIKICLVFCSIINAEEKYQNIIKITIRSKSKKYSK